MIGAIVGIFAGLFKLFVSTSALSPFQVYSSLAFGVVSILIGAFILYKIRKPSPCQAQNSVAAANKRGKYGVDFGAFSLGLSRGLILCPPLIALVLYAVPFSNFFGAVALAVLFGLGTTLSPLLLLGGVTGWLLNKAPLLRTYISVGGAAVLIVLGAVTVISSTVHL